MLIQKIHAMELRIERNLRVWSSNFLLCATLISSREKGSKHSVHYTSIREVRTRVALRPFSSLHFFFFFFLRALNSVRLIHLNPPQCWCCVLFWLQNFGKSPNTRERPKWDVATAFQLEISNFYANLWFFMPGLPRMQMGSRNSCIAYTNQDQVCYFFPSSSIQVHAFWSNILKESSLLKGTSWDTLWHIQSDLNLIMQLCWISLWISRFSTLSLG